MPRRPRVGVDVQAAHVGEVEDDAAVDGAVAGQAVAAATDRELELVVAREQDGPRDVACVGRADDRERPGVHRRLVHPAGRLVFIVARQDHAAGEAAGERVEIHRLVDEGLRRILASRCCAPRGVVEAGVVCDRTYVVAAA